MKKSEFPQFFRSLGRYYACGEIRLLEKVAVTAFVLLYIISPVDLIPDVPVIGWLDDIGIGTLFWVYCSWRVQKMEPQEKTIQKNRDASGDDVLIAEVISAHTTVDRKTDGAVKHHDEQLFSEKKQYRP